MNYILLDGYSSLLSMAAMYILVTASRVGGRGFDNPLKSVNACSTKTGMSVSEPPISLMLRAVPTWMD